jgi:peptide/nickel transport system substrate-binding protein
MEETMKGRKFFANFFGIFVIVSLMLAGCAQTGQQQVAEQKVATFIWTQEFDSLNPLYSNMWFSIVTHQLWNAWAWEFDENNEAFPKLVTEIPSFENGGITEDGKTITMKLRQDLKWSDGTALSSKDFLFTYNMAVDPKNTVASTYPYENVETMEAPDDYTVVINFTDPFAPWAATLWHGILPAHILQPIYDADGTIDNAEWNSNPTVGCGPYVLAEWETASFARFVRNENYWGESPIIDEIFMRFVPDDASQVAALQSGDGDLGTFIAYSDIPSLEEAGIKIQTVLSGYNEGLFFTVSEEMGHPALLDVNVRKAFVLAFDRESLNRDLLLGLTQPPASFWDSLPYYNDPPLENYPYDPEEAKRLLDEAGWIDSNGDGVRDKDGVELVLSYGTTIREIRQDTQAVAQQQLAEVGIKLDIASYDDELYFSNYGEGPAASGDIDIMQWSDGPIFPDADIYYWLCSEIPNDEYPQGSNWFFICDEELDRLIQLQSTQVNPAERQESISKINQIFHDQVYWIGLWQDPDVWALGKRFGELKISGVTPFFDITNWDLQP